VKQDTHVAGIEGLWKVQASSDTRPQLIWKPESESIREMMSILAKEWLMIVTIYK
jgi:hypothetical protein